VDHPPASTVQALGTGHGLVDRLLGLGQATVTDSYSQDAIMERYYSLKKANRLSDLTLEDGKRLAPLLVEAAITYSTAHPESCMGIGGSIDVLTVTKEGTEWVRKKTNTAPIPPVYRLRIEDSDMNKTVTPLDGEEWLRPRVPASAIITFNGMLDARVAQPKFAGPCTFIIGPDAERHMPETTARLKATFEKACDVYQESPSGRVKISSPTAAQGQTFAERPDHSREYACMSDLQLKRAVLDFTAQFEVQLESRKAYDDRQFEEEAAAERQLHTQEERNVLGLKYDLQRRDTSSKWTSDYDSEIVPRIDAMLQEMVDRLHQPHHQNASERGWTTQEMYQLIEDLDTFASKLSNSDNPPHGCVE
jgi:hypothetical protein